eukprot:2005838-Alexandrium_andersonii.AAC.1
MSRAQASGETRPAKRLSCRASWSAMGRAPRPVSLIVAPVSAAGSPCCCPRPWPASMRLS